MPPFLLKVVPTPVCLPTDTRFTVGQHPRPTGPNPPFSSQNGAHSHLFSSVSHGFEQVLHLLARKMDQAARSRAPESPQTRFTVGQELILG